MSDPATASDVFKAVVAPALLADAPSESSPELCFVASALASGRSRATSSTRARSVLLNARDLELLARRLVPADEAEAPTVAAEWLQQGLALARERRTSVTLEGRFRSPRLLSGVSQMFARAGFRTRLVVVAERPSEVRLSDTSRALDALRRRVDPLTGGGWEPVDVAEIVAAAPTDRVTVLDRTGAVVVDAERGTPEFDGARSALENAAASQLGTLRSTLWLSQLRRMTRFVGERPPVPTWAIDELIALHELALEEIVPELEIPAGSDTRRVQELRLSATLAALRDFRSTGLPDSRTLEVPEYGPPVTPTPQSSAPGIGR